MADITYRSGFGEVQPLRDPSHVQYAIKGHAYKIQDLLRIRGRKYWKEPVTVVTIMQGGMIYAAHFVRHLQGPVIMDFMHASQLKIHDELRTVIDIDCRAKNIHDQYVILVDDILDSGVTMQKCLQNIRGMGPKGVVCTTLVHKLDVPNQKVPPDGDFVCDVQVDSYKWVVGMGMDYNGLYRNLDYIGYVPNAAVDYPSLQEGIYEPR